MIQFAAPGPAGVEHLPDALPLGQLLLADRQGQLQSHLLPPLLPLPAPLLPLPLVHLAPPSRPLCSRGDDLPPLTSRLVHRPATLWSYPGSKPKAKGVAQELQREAEVRHLERENILKRENINERETINGREINN